MAAGQVALGSVLLVPGCEGLTGALHVGSFCSRTTWTLLWVQQCLGKLPTLEPTELISISWSPSLNLMPVLPLGTLAVSANTCGKQWPYASQIWLAWLLSQISHRCLLADSCPC